MMNVNSVKHFLTSPASALQIGGVKGDIALGVGVALGASQSIGSIIGDYRPDAAASVGLGVGAGAGALLMARKLPMTFATHPRATVITGILAGVGLIGMVAAPSARADVLPTDPFYRWKKEGGEVVLPGEEIRSSDGMAKADKPKIEDKTAEGATSSARQGGYADNPNFIVIAATGDGATKYEGDGPAAGSFTEAFKDPKTKASTHYVIDRAGNISMYVDPKLRANHTAGMGTNDGRPGWNSASIGIDLVNDNTGTQEYTVKQMEAARQLTQSLGGEFKIPASHVLMHRHVQDNKADPVGFPWREWADSLDDGDPLEGRVSTLQVEDPGANTTMTNNDVAADANRGKGGTEYPDTKDDKLPAPAPSAPGTAEPTASAKPEPSASVKPEPSKSATPEPTKSATPEPTTEPSTEPTAEPTASAKPKPKATGKTDPTPTGTPTDKATDTPTDQDTDAPPSDGESRATPSDPATAPATVTPAPIETLNPDVKRGPSTPTTPAAAPTETTAPSEPTAEPGATDTPTATPAASEPAASEPAAPRQPSTPAGGTSGIIGAIEKAFAPRHDAAAPAPAPGERSTAPQPKTGNLFSTLIGLFA